MARQLGIDKTKHDFRFTRNWFLNRNLRTFRSLVRPAWLGRPCQYLELGVFEGQSHVWMHQHVLTHPWCRSVGVDPWLQTTKLSESSMADVYARAVHNLAPYIQAGRTILVRGNSAEILRRMNTIGCAGINPGIVDVCLVDGNHNALAVWDDARLVVPLMAHGGWILFDDVENKTTYPDHVRAGIDLWLGENPPVRLEWKNEYMECYVKEGP